jgi:hypothetical protein
MTRTSGKLYLVDPPDIRLKPPPDPVWITPIVDPQPTLSTEAMCRQWLKAEISKRGKSPGVRDIWVRWLSAAVL